jgi:hypothetical protein
MERGLSSTEALIPRLAILHERLGQRNNNAESRLGRMMASFTDAAIHFPLAAASKSWIASSASAGVRA